MIFYRKVTVPFDGISWKRLGYISRYIVTVTVPANDPRGKRLRHRPRAPPLQTLNIVYFVSPTLLILL